MTPIHVGKRLGHANATEVLRRYGSPAEQRRELGLSPKPNGMIGTPAKGARPADLVGAGQYPPKYEDGAVRDR